MLKWLKKILDKGVKIGYSDGNMYDPYYQDRTDPIADIIKKEKERKNELDK